MYAALDPCMSAPWCTTTYQWPDAGGKAAGTCVRASAAPVPSATTWFSPNLIGPGALQLPVWTCDTWDEPASSPVI